ncbi:MAG: tyrosine-type recombinase/integrase [Planctomycetota bacterium]
MHPERRTRKLADGTSRVDEKCSIRVRHNGVQRRISLFKSKATSVAFCRKLERLVDSKSGGEAIDREMMAWIGSLSPYHLGRFTELRLIDPRRISTAVPLEAHLEDWHRSIVSKGSDKEHAGDTLRRARKVFAGVSARVWGDLDALEIESWLGDQTGDEGWSVATRNHHANSVKQFTRWMVNCERAQFDPLRAVTRWGAGKGKQRRPRRALTLEECRALLRAVEESDRVIGHCSPATRWMLYFIAMLTGFRHGECRGLRVAWIEFGTVVRDPETGWLVYDGLPTRIAPPANATKAGRKSGRIDVIVVPIELHLRLQDHVRNRHPRAFVLEREDGLGKLMPPNGAAMLKQDLAAAGIQYCDDAGRYADFHALRHTALTMFSDAHPSEAEMQQMARHSDPKITRQYLHTRLARRAEVVARLPKLTAHDAEDRPGEKMAAGAEARVTVGDSPPPQIGSGRHTDSGPGGPGRLDSPLGQKKAIPDSRPGSHQRRGPTAVARRSAPESGCIGRSRAREFPP